MRIKEKEKIINIPNIISLYRLFSVPILFYVAYNGQEKIFFYWFLFNVSTDALDGFIARKFNMKTKIGAKLDSLADFAMYILATFAMIHLKYSELKPVLFSFYLIIFYYLLIDIFALIKFKEISSLHLYLSKLNGIIQSGFFILLFTVGYNKYYYWLMFFLATISFLENMYFLTKLRKMQSNLKGYIWTIRKKDIF